MLVRAAPRLSWLPCYGMVAALCLSWPAVPAANEVAPAARHEDVTRLHLLGDSRAGDWSTAGRDWRQSYYSPLKKIHKGNVTRLGHAWSYDIDFSAPFEATPLVVGGKLFTSGSRGSVYALDARNGALLWSFQPDIDSSVFSRHCCGGVNRGVAVWRGKVYVAAVDGYLYALDAATGNIVWRADTIVDRSRDYSSTGAPYIANDLVIIGNSGAEYNARGYFTAYRTDTGQQAWRFFTVPGDPRKGFEHPELAMAARTWDPNSPWQLGGGGTVWDGMAYDPKLQLLYVGTGNGTPWNPRVRSPAGGDNLFLASILAIDASSGRLAWHYQTTPRNDWDYTANQKLILAQLRIGGRTRQVLMQAPKNGFFYVLDRKTGELLSAKPYAYVNWASHVDPATGRPVETGRADYSRAPKLVFPTSQGAHNWNPMSFNPRTGLVYIPVLERGEIFGNLTSPFEYRPGRWNIGVTTRAAVPGSLDTPDTRDWPSLESLRAGEPDPRARTFLRAWDPVRQALAWEVETTPGMDDPSADSAVMFARHMAGVMSTASGLLFQGHIDGYLRARDATDGRLLHSIDVGTSMIAAPMTYMIGADQYIAIMAGANARDPLFADYRFGPKGRIVALKLDGGAVPRRTPVDHSGDTHVAPPAPDQSSPKQLQLGEQLFDRHCVVCHDGSRAPDLSRMSAQTRGEFMDIVLRGRRAERGMASFGTVLSEQEAKAIQAFLSGSRTKPVAPAHCAGHCP